MIRLTVHLDVAVAMRSAREDRDPDPVALAIRAESGGADSVSLPLAPQQGSRALRDLRLLRPLLRGALNLELSSRSEPDADIFELLPDQVTLVHAPFSEMQASPPLDLTIEGEVLGPLVARLHAAGMRVVAFVPPDPAQMVEAARLGLDGVELDTSSYAASVVRPGWTVPEDRAALLEGRFVRGGSHPAQLLGQLASAATVASDHGLSVAAGRGLSRAALPALATLPGLEEVHVGHALFVRALEIGLEEAVREVRGLLRSS
ncbi:MAG: pyridoxine 5'-phosphate synthase [Candidatus Sericytochromatia bacterium]|nr:pyridoxine 5'-phosphate synthase [Candidatus Sericytochromatia bacterium]